MEMVSVMQEREDRGRITPPPHARIHAHTRRREREGEGEDKSPLLHYTCSRERRSEGKREKSHSPLPHVRKRARA